MGRKCAIICSFLVVLLGLLFAWAGQQTNRINKQGFDRIHDGMTQEDVIAILGAPPGDYSSAVRTAQDTETKRILELSFHTHWEKACLTWYSDEGAIQVSVDRQDKIFGKQYHAFTPTWEGRLSGWWNRVCKRFRR